MPQVRLAAGIPTEMRGKSVKLLEGIGTADAFFGDMKSKPEKEYALSKHTLSGGQIRIVRANTHIFF